MLYVCPLNVHFEHKLSVFQLIIYFRTSHTGWGTWQQPTLQLDMPPTLYKIWNETGMCSIGQITDITDLMELDINSYQEPHTLPQCQHHSSVTRILLQVRTFEDKRHRFLLLICTPFHPTNSVKTRKKITQCDHSPATANSLTFSLAPHSIPGMLHYSCQVHILVRASYQYTINVSE